ncbi:MAG: hypothetical protein WAW34_14370 [Rhodoferax sp.]
MPLAIIFGLAKGQSDRIKAQANHSAVSFREGWAVRFQLSTGANQNIRAADVRAALSEARGAAESVHILGITNQGGNVKAALAREFIPAFRFRWLPSEWLSLPYPTPMEFVARVNELLIDEEDWRAKVQPNDRASPLLLPQRAFSTSLNDAWDMATRYGEGNNIGCERRLLDFHQRHWKQHSSGHYARKSFWTDDDQRVFDHTGPTHAPAPVERARKFSYGIPEGFHYDLRQAQGRKFVARGAVSDRQVETEGYVNIDPYGYFRDDDQVAP